MTAETVVVFLSDHGSAYGQLGLWGNSSWGEPAPAYNANMQVPLIVRHPGLIAPGKRQRAMINQFDLLPTLLDYLGLDPRVPNSPGRSFAPMLRGAAIADWPDEVFFEFITTRVVQTRAWKYTKRFLAAPDELYDMAADPGETRNLIGEPAHAATVAALDRRLTEFWARNSDPVYDLWRGGTGKALVSYGAENQRFRDHFPNWRDPFVIKASAYHDPAR
jgi:arylsulfatase A-like enzyme